MDTLIENSDLVKPPEIHQASAGISFGYRQLVMLGENPSNPTTIRHYFVDESGDGVLFDSKGRIVFGNQGAPKHFIIGLADIPDPIALNTALDKLRNELLADQYFKGVPSMQPEEGKTALYFHAKDDLAEVRREVFRLLLQHEIKFFAVVKRMQSVLEYVHARNRREATYRYHPNELYDHAVKRLFKTRLHKDEEYLIRFARRGQSNRTRTLAEALESARSRFCKEQGIVTSATIGVKCVNARDEGGLQAVDYFLWALQRLYERQEDRYLQLIWSKVSLVHDVDDVRVKKYGVYYTKEKPLTANDLQ